MASWQTTVNIVFNRTNSVDPITRILDLVLTWSYVEMDVNFWSQFCSFTLVGVLIATSIRGLLKNLMKVFHAYASPVTSNHIVLLLAHIMGMYFTSSVLLLRMKLPEEYR